MRSGFGAALRGSFPGAFGDVGLADGGFRIIQGGTAFAGVLGHLGGGAARGRGAGRYGRRVGRRLGRAGAGGTGSGRCRTTGARSGRITLCGSRIGVRDDAVPCAARGGRRLIGGFPGDRAAAGFGFRGSAGDLPGTLRDEGLATRGRRIRRWRSIIRRGMIPRIGGCLVGGPTGSATGGLGIGRRGRLTVWLAGGVSAGGVLAGGGAAGTGRVTALDDRFGLERRDVAGAGPAVEARLAGAGGARSRGGRARVVCRGSRGVFSGSGVFSDSRVGGECGVFSDSGVGGGCGCGVSGCGRVYAGTRGRVRGGRAGIGCGVGAGGAFLGLDVGGVVDGGVAAEHAAVGEGAAAGAVFVADDAGRRRLDRVRVGGAAGGRLRGGVAAAAATRGRGR